MKIYFIACTSLLISICSYASPTVEAVLAANNMSGQRYGIGNNNPDVECAIYASPAKTHYQYVLAGGLITNGSPVWYTPYGGSAGQFNIRDWSIITTENKLVFAYNQDDSVIFTYDAETLKITAYTEDFRSLGYGLNTCILN